MDESLEDLKRRFLETAESAKVIDPELGFELWCLLVTHDWFATQLNNRVCDLVRKWGGNWDDVKELKQDVVLQLRLDMNVKPTLGLDLERARRTFRAWVNRIIHNISVDLAESRFGRSLPVEQGAQPNHVAVSFRGFEDIDLQFLVSQLPEPDRRAVTLRIEGKELEEIAEEMEQSVKQVRTILARVRKRLRRLLRNP